MNKHRFWIIMLTMCLCCCGAMARESQFAKGYQPASGHLEALKASQTLVGIQYEQWFMGPNSWKTAEAIPMLGKYTTDEATVTRHYAEFGELGIDWLLIDWSNMLWMKPEWEQHTGDSLKLEEKTDVLFKTAVKLSRQGKYAPKLVFMIGLQNGPRVERGVERLNGMLSWIEARYLNRPEYKDLWLYVNGKPLIVILYWPRHPCSQLKSDLVANSLRSSAWTVRWMASQLQDNRAERCGMWSWMDGTIPQVLTKHDGKPEEIVVTPASFHLPGAGTGWMARSAIGRDHGVPYLESWRAAFEDRPRFIQIHQWNEFTGQKDGEGIPLNYWGQRQSPAELGQQSAVYGDEYNLELSDDIEPTKLHGCTLRGCGGWGYYYFNLTKAILSLYRGDTPDITVLALSEPQGPQPFRGEAINLRWQYLGRQPTSYSLLLDGRLVEKGIKGKQFTLDLSDLTAGKHSVTLLANGVYTYFDLDPSAPASRSPVRLPVSSEVTLQLAR